MKTKKISTILVVLLVFLTVSLACQSTWLTENQTAQEQQNLGNDLNNDNNSIELVDSGSVYTSVDLVSQEDALISLYQKVNDGVVAIMIYTHGGTIIVGSGSGFVVDSEGHIVTNYHVVEDAGANDLEVQVAFTAGIKTRAEVVGVDEDSDLAVLEVNVDKDVLHPLEFGDSSALSVGQVVVAIGNPFGFNGTMTTGVISGIGRTLDSLNQSTSGQYFAAGDIIQTDAAINPGNSGGPLLNLDGEVIGINRAIQTYNTNANDQPINSGIGFAVSSNIVNRVIPGLIEGGSFDYPYLGISSWSDFPLAEAERLGLKKTLGALITSVVSGGPADDAGLLVDDVILEINGTEVTDFSSLLSYLFNYTSPGDEVDLVVFRDGETMDLPMVIGARP
jgi:S1-C subfamily serine protease